ncbi:MAG TPA: nitroreductase/quinone reductase family protein [Solirubrobacterales bacterium]|jgi:deazaflavin-dependent oxidoreductase (nitroreductase family)|nr:nitroreductase/quinone reductase family protein [Solirubrobacterales bacterium]
MDERTALRQSRLVGIGSLAIGAAMFLWPRRMGRPSGLEPRDARLVALGDLAVGPGLIWGRPRRPWLFARAAVNVGIGGLLLRRGSPLGRAIAVGLGAATAADLRLAAALRDEADAAQSLNARINLAASDALNDRGIYLGRRSTKVHVAIYRRSGGRLGAVTPGWPDAKIALVDHRGAKSGIDRTSPLVYCEDGASLAVIASKAGQPTHPAWFHNLMASPETTVQIRAEVRPVRARLATEEESERIWPAFVDAYPAYATYRERARPRVIPIVILEPRPAT